MGLTLTSHSQAKSTVPRLSEVEGEFVARRLEDGASPKQIEEESGITVASIREYMITELGNVHLDKACQRNRLIADRPALAQQLSCRGKYSTI